MADTNSPYQLPTGIDTSRICLLAHDLMNNLSVILGRCELLAEHLQSNEAAEKHLHVIVYETHQMAARIVNRPCQMTEAQRNPASHDFSKAEGGDAFS